MTLSFLLRAENMSVKVAWDMYGTWALHVENSVHTL